MPAIPISIQANRLATGLIQEMKQRNELERWVQLHTLNVTFVYRSNYKFTMYLTNGQRLEVEAAR
jgi:hypothetical protein